MYSFLRSLLFLLPPEEAHYFVMNVLREANKNSLLRKMIVNNFSFADTSLHKNLFGLQFANPVGLGAGFDKNALYLNELASLGFGFVEIGTVTPLAQSGSPKPRLFRLPKDKALINRMGFNNDGVEIISKRLKLWNEHRYSRRKDGKLKDGPPLVVGGNIGKNKITPNEDAWKDYERCFNGLFDCVDYFVVNVSSPNTPGLRALQEKDALEKILAHLQTINYGKPKPKPLLLKIAPDLNKDQLDDIIDLSLQVKLDGLVATNTTIAREELRTSKTKLGRIGAGGLSGKPLMERSTEVLSYLCQQLKGQIPVIASGGIFTGADAHDKFEAGASLLEIWTGFIYEGPFIVKNICKYLSSFEK